MNEFIQERMKDGKPLSGQALAQLLGRFRNAPSRIGSHGPVRAWPLELIISIILRKKAVPVPEAVPVRQTVQRKSSGSRCLA